MGIWESIEARPNGEWHEPETESADSFFIEHYWGYNRQRDGATMEYEVTRPKWRVRPAQLTNFDAGLKAFIGEEWGIFSNHNPNRSFWPKAQKSPSTPAPEFKLRDSNAA